MAGFLEVLLQFFFRLPAALTYGPHLLRCRSGVGVLVRAVILRAVSDFLSHTEIVPPRVSVGKAPLHVQPNDMSNPDDGGRARRRPRVSGARSGLPGSGVAITGGGNPEAGWGKHCAGCSRTLLLGTRQAVEWRNRSTPSSPRDSPV